MQLLLGLTQCAHVFVKRVSVHNDDINVAVSISVRVVSVRALQKNFDPSIC